MSTVADILQGHIQTMQKINEDGLAHMERVSACQTKLLERYVPDADKVAGELTPPEAKKDSSDAPDVHG